MINQGSYTPIINRSPDERKYGGGNLLKKQYQNYSKQNNINQSEEVDVENPISNQRDEQLKTRQDRERLFMSDPNSSSKNFWDQKYSPSSQIEPQGIDKFRDQQKKDSLVPSTPGLDAFRNRQNNR